MREQNAHQPRRKSRWERWVDRAFMLLPAIILCFWMARLDSEVAGLIRTARDAYTERWGGGAAAVAERVEKEPELTGAYSARDGMWIVINGDEMLRIESDPPQWLDARAEGELPPLRSVTVTVLDERVKVRGE